MVHLQATASRYPEQIIVFIWFNDILILCNTLDIVKNIYGLDRCGRCSKDVRLVRSGILQRITYYCETCQRLYTATTSTIDCSSTTTTSSSSSGISSGINAIGNGGNSNVDHRNRNNSTVSRNSTAGELSHDLNLPSIEITKWKCRFCEYLNMVSDLDGPSNGICAICGEASNIVPKERNSLSDGFFFKSRSAGDANTIKYIVLRISLTITNVSMILR